MPLFCDQNSGIYNALNFKNFSVSFTEINLFLFLVPEKAENHEIESVIPQCFFLSKV